MKKHIVLLLLCILVSCSAKKAVIAETPVNNKLSADKIIENHYKNKLNFNTLYIKSSVSYRDPDQSQNVTAEIKIKKDEIILVSIRILGITMAKALITPEKVQYYEKLNSSYFDGNYSALSKLLGTELNFQKVQSLLLGQAFDNLKIEKYNFSLEENSYKLESVSNTNISKKFYLSSDNFLIKKEEIVFNPEKPIQTKIDADKTYAEYSHYFLYGKSDFSIEEKEFVEFIGNCQKVIDQKAFVTIKIEGSASYVPTVSSKTNEILSNERSVNAQAALTKALLKNGYLENVDFKFAAPVNVVQGKKFENDAVANRAEYEKYQYIKVKVQ